MPSVKPIPEGYHSITPYLSIAGASEAIEFYKKAFGAIELFRMDGPGRKGRTCRDPDRRFASDAG